MKRVLFFAIALPTLVSASTVLTNAPAWNGVNGVASWGDSNNNPTFGQTITVPTNGDNVLTSFTFEIEGGASSMNFDANIQAWSGTGAAGSLLFSAVGTALPSASYSTYTFNPNVALTPGSVYILYFTTVGVSQSNLDSFAWGATFTDTYSGGDFWFNGADQSDPAAGNASDLNSAQWSNARGAVYDLAFSATFTASQVPEPGSFVLSATALAAIGLLGILRKAV
jgi:hypothetical protein